MTKFEIVLIVVAAALAGVAVVYWKRTAPEVV
jgi:hypothetical protein